MADLWQMEDRCLVNESYGVLVGWTHIGLNDRLILKIESTCVSQDGKPDDIHENHFMMTQNQAMLLANSLLNMSNMSPPVRRKKSVIQRIIGSIV
jgi:hypothetical protein